MTEPDRASLSLLQTLDKSLMKTVDDDQKVTIRAYFITVLGDGVADLPSLKSTQRCYDLAQVSSGSQMTLRR